MGKPLKFKTPAELQKKVNAYFAMATKKKEPFLITSLALFLDTNRQTLLEYEGEVEGRSKGQTDDDKQRYADIIKKAKDRCSDYLFKSALTNKVNPIIAIFGLKANHKWKDKDEPQVVVNNSFKEIPEEHMKKINEVLAREYDE